MNENSQDTIHEYRTSLSYLLSAGSFSDLMAEKYPDRIVAVEMTLSDCNEMVRILNEYRRKGNNESKQRV